MTIQELRKNLNRFPDDTVVWIALIDEHADMHPNIEFRFNSEEKELELRAYGAQMWLPKKSLKNILHHTLTRR